MKHLTFLVAVLLSIQSVVSQPIAVPFRNGVRGGDNFGMVNDLSITVRAGSDKTTTTAGTITLDGEVSGVTGYTVRWSKVSGPGTVTFSSNAALRPTASFSAIGDYTLVLVSTLGFYRYNNDYMIVHVSGGTVNIPPEVSTISDQAVNEDTATAAIPFAISDNETAAASLTVSAVSSNPALVPASGIALGGSGANRTVTLTPLANQNGQTTITISVSDGTATSSSSFILTVAAVNDAPAVSSIGNQNTPEDVATPQIGFTVTDLETAAASLSVAGASGNTTLVPNANIVFSGSGNSRSVQITPALNQTGSALITVTVGDGTTTTQTTFTVNVGQVNDPPTIATISGSTISEDTNTGAKAFTVGDAETAAASLTLSGHSSDPFLVADTAIVFGGSGANRTVTVTPLANANGTATITVSVSDGTASTSTTWPLTVNAVNDTPTITAIPNQSVIGSSSIDVPFAIQDADVGDTLFLSGTSDNQAVVANGGITFIGTGNNRTARITPASNANASCNITILVSDTVASASRTFQVTVQQVNSTPTISAIADQSGTEDGPFANIPFTIGDAETPPASLVLTKTSSNPGLLPDSGIVFGGSGANRTVTLTPAPNGNGTATVTIRVTDASNQFRDEAFTATWSGVNDAPTSTQINSVTMAEDASTSRTVDIADAETSASGLTVTASTPNTTLFPSLTPTGTGSTRTIPLVPAANQSGTATITYIVSDGQLSASKSFTVTVTAVNEPPTISNVGNSAGSVGQAAVLNFTASDNANEDAPDALVYSKTSSNTTAVPTANIVFGGSGINRTVTITGAAAGTSTIAIRATDSGSLFAEDTFDFVVSAPANTAPTITDIGNQTISQNGNTGALAFTVGDAQTAPGSLSVSATSSNPTLVPTANIVFGGSGASRTVTVTPAANQSGTATITVFVSDGNLSNSDAFTLTVTAVNQAPVIAEITDKSTNEDAPIEFGISATDADHSTLTWTAASGNTTLVPNASIVFLDGTAKANRIRVTPAANLSGTALITVTANDGTATDQETFTITVNSANDAPTITSIGDKSTSQNTTSGPHSFTVGDQETSAGSLTVTGSSSNQSLVQNSGISFGGSGSSRTVTVAPVSGQSGQATITVGVNDGTTSTTTTFVLTVTATGGLVYHVKTGGTSGGSGTEASPWSLTRSFSRSGGKPEVGATVYVHADGRYNLGTTGASISANGVTWRGFGDGWPNIGSDNLGSDRTTLHPSADDITLYQLAINNPGRVHPAEGIYTSGDARRLKIIHCIVFNLPQCIAFQDNRSDGGGLEVYGTVMMFGGWNNSPDDAGGHNVYFQHANVNDSLQFENNVSAYSFSKLLNCGGSEAAFNRNFLFYQNILLMDGGASQAASTLQRPVEYIALVGNTPIQAGIYKDNFHYGGQLLFGYPDPQNIDLTVTGNYEFHQGYANGTFSGMRFEKFNTLIITNNIVDASFEPTMDLNNSGAVTRTINRNAYHGTLDFNPGGSFAGWQSNGYDAQGSATTAHRDTLYVRYYLNTRYGHRHKAQVAIHNPQSTGTVNIDGAQAGLSVNDQFVVLNSLHPDLTLPHAFRVVASGTYLGGNIAINMNSLTVAQPAGVSYSIPNCAPRAAGLIVKKTN